MVCGERRTSSRIRTTRTSKRILAAQGRAVSCRARPTARHWADATAPARGDRALVSTTAGAGSTTACARPSSKASSCSCRCSTTTRPCTARSVRRDRHMPATPKPGRAAGRCRRSRICSRPGTVLALNFPVAMNPGLARALGVMLKLDFQRAVLQRIPKIAAQPGSRLARSRLRLRRVPRLCHRRRNGPDRRRAHVRAVPPGAADSDRRDAEHQLAAIGAAGRRELAHAAAVLPHQGVPRHERRVHGQSRGRTVRTPRPAQGALHARRSRARRARLAAHRARGRDEAVAQREQELRAAPRVHLPAARVHRAAERAGHRACPTTASTRCRRSSAT